MTIITLPDLKPLFFTSLQNHRSINDILPLDLKNQWWMIFLGKSLVYKNANDKGEKSSKVTVKFSPKNVFLDLENKLLPPRCATLPPPFWLCFFSIKEDMNSQSPLKNISSRIIRRFFDIGGLWESEFFTQFTLHF